MTGLAQCCVILLMGCKIVWANEDQDVKAVSFGHIPVGGRRLQAAAVINWPEPANYDILGEGWCLGDDLYREPHSMAVKVVANTTEDMATICLDLCDKLALQHNLCMGIQINSQGQCILYDRDWVTADVSKGDALGYAMDSEGLRGGGILQGFAGQHMTRAETVKAILDSRADKYKCYRRKFDCSSAPVCVDLGRYPCNVGKIANTCDQCLPRKETAYGSVAAGNDACVPAAYVQPTLRMTWGAATAMMNQNDNYDGYNQAMLGCAYTMKWAFQQADDIVLPIAPIDRQDFGIEFVGFTTNYTRTTSKAAGGTGEVSPTVSTTIMMMGGGTGGILEELDIRMTDPVGKKVQVSLGSASSLTAETSLAEAGLIFGVPVIGHLFTSKSLQYYSYYLRANRVALDESVALARVYKSVKYNKIFVYKGTGSAGDVVNTLRMELPNAAVIEDGPPLSLLGTSGNCAGCLLAQIDAWRRLREADARVIVHVNLCSTLELFVASLATDILGEKAFYTQIGHSCSGISYDLNLADWEEETRGIMQFYQLMNTTGPKPYDVMDWSATVATPCKICTNIAEDIFGDNPEREDLELVISYMFNTTKVTEDYGARAAQNVAYHRNWCPWLPDEAAVRSGIGGLDATANQWKSAECAPLAARFTYAMRTHICIKADLSYDNFKREEYLNLLDHVGEQDPPCTDTDPPGRTASAHGVFNCWEGMAPGGSWTSYCGAGYDDEDFSSDMCCGCGGGTGYDWESTSDRVVAKLKAAGAPASYFEPYYRGGRLFEQGIQVTGKPMTYMDHWRDTAMGAAMNKQTLGNMFDQEFFDAMLTALVAYNEFVKLGGDMDASSSITAPPVVAKEGNPVARGWRRFLLDVNFAGNLGQVDYVAQSGERNIKYQIMQATEAKSEKSIVTFRLDDLTQNLSAADKELDGLALERVHGDWNFLSAFLATEQDATLAAPPDRLNYEGCEPIAPGSMENSISIVSRGTCYFGTKALYSQAAGAIGLLIVNNRPGRLPLITAQDNNIKIPGYIISETAQKVLSTVQRGIKMSVNVPYTSQTTSADFGTTRGQVFYALTIGYDVKKDTLKWAPRGPNPNIVLDMTITNIDYLALRGDAALHTAFKTAIHDVIISSAGRGLTPSHVTSTTMPGSVQVSVSMSPPQGFAPSSLKLTVDALRDKATDNLAARFVTAIKSVNNIYAATLGDIKAVGLITRFEDAPLTDLNMRWHTGTTKPLEVPAVCGWGDVYDLTNRQCVPCPEGTFSPAAGSKCQKCSPGYIATGVGNKVCSQCPGGTAAVDEAACVPCEPGTYANAGRYQKCELCHAGTQRNATQSATRCTECLPGWYSPEGSPECMECQRGSKSEKASSPTCDICEAGWYTLQAGSTECTMCPMGTYSPVPFSADCIKCPDPKHSTVYQASVSYTQCVCREGTFLHPDAHYQGSGDVARNWTNYISNLFDFKLQGADPGCIPCKEGLKCNQRNEPPLSVEGYYVKTSSAPRDYNVIQCRNTDECVNGPIGNACQIGREGLGCGNCKEKHYKADRGVCGECDGPSILPVIATIVGGLIGVCFLYRFASIDATKQKLTSVTAALCIGQVCSAVQAMGVFQQLTITWPEPVGSVLKVLGLLTFDLDVIRIQCLFGRDNPLINYITRLFLHPIFATLLALIFLFQRKFRSRGAEMDFDRLVNAEGLVLMVAYISFTLSILLPFQCVSNPDGTHSMASNPAVECFATTDHQVMMVFGCIFVLLYPVSIIAKIALLTKQYQGLILTGHGLSLVKRYRFLFNRFKPTTYGFGLVHIVRSTLVALVPVLFPGRPMWQCVTMGVVLLSFSTFQSRVWPWRTQVANACDLGINFGLIVVMMGAGFLIDVDEDAGEETLGAMMFTAVMIVLACIIIAGMWTAYKHFMKGKQYAAFLCHHKGGAAVLGRYFKMKLSKVSSAEVFLDCDQLDDLDLLFDTVRQDLENLVILLTKETLFRMWCAGEVCTAVSNGVNMSCIACDDYVAFDEESLKRLDNDVWTEEQKHTLYTYGMDIETVKACFRKLNEIPLIAYKRFASSKEQEEGVVAIAKTLKNFPLMSSRSSIGDPKPAKIVVIGNPNDAEAICICEVVREMVQFRVHEQTEVVRTVEMAEMHQRTAVYMLITFTKGVLKEVMFADVLLKLREGGGGEEKEIITINADTSFDFPDPGFYARLEQCGEPIVRSPEHGKQLAEMYGAMMKILAIGFSGHGSLTILNTQVDAICRRCRFNAGVTATVSKSKSGSKGNLYPSEGSANSANSNEEKQPPKQDNAEQTEMTML
jgi:hypothetical protein